MIQTALRDAIAGPGPRRPPQRAELPWAGSGVAFTRRPLSFLQATHDRLGSDLVRFGYFGKTIHSLRGAEATELFFSATNLDLKEGFVEIFGGLLPKRFIGDSDEELYAFSKRRAVFNFSRYLDAVFRSTAEVLHELGTEGEIDLFDLSSELSFRASSRFMLGEEVMSPGFFGRWRRLFFETNPVESLGKFQWNLLNPLFWRRQERLFGDLEALLERLIDIRQGVVQGEEASFLDVGLSEIYPRKSRQKAVGHLYMMFLAAYLNPALSLGWILVDVLRQDRSNPYRSRVLEEIDALAEGHPAKEPLPREVLDQLDVLQLCVLETLRLRVKAVNVRKVRDEPLVFRGYEIGVGSVVCNSPTFAHMSAEHYEAPERFLPERWQGTPELERSSMSARYMPFGTFSHICPGKRFSHVWLKSSVAELLRRFEIAVVGPVPAVREGIMPVLGDRSGPCMIRYRRRPQAA
ncbi:MAG: cytochrome P450, partial [Myxococcota bacterium]